MFRATVIAHTDWVQYWIVVVYLNPGNLRLSQDLPHHNCLTPDISPSFSGCGVGVMVIWCLQMLLLTKSKFMRFFDCFKKLCQKIPIKHRLDTCDDCFSYDSLI